MNDRDVMNKIIAKIKALEDVISGGGSGGEGGNSGITVIHFTDNPDPTSEYDPLTTDKTPTELATALSNGNIIYATADGYEDIFYLKTYNTDADTEDGNFFYFMTLPTIYTDSIGSTGISYATGVCYSEQVVLHTSSVD